MRESSASAPSRTRRRAETVAAPRNADIAAVFEEIADLLDLHNDNPFRIRAYRNAARTLKGYGRDIASLLLAGEELPKLPGIGADLAERIAEIARTGDCALRRQLRRHFPPGVVGLLRIGGLGPRRVQTLYRELGVESPQQLLDAARAGRVRGLPRFGAGVERKLIEAVEHHLQSGRRVALAEAVPQAERCAAFLRALPGVERVEIAGSLRRMRDTVGDVDLLAIAAPDSEVCARFADYGEVREVLAQGPTRASVVLRSGLQVDLRVVAAESYGAALVYFTGSKAHNIAIRRIAQDRGLKISEYGVFRDERRVAGDTEASVYAALDLPVIAQELREDRGEVQAARAGRLPKLIELKHLRGDLHVHTDATDGHDTLGEMAEAAKAAGLEYLAITDHSSHLTTAHGMDADWLLQQCERIDQLNRRLKGLTLLKGIEVDILEDGSLDLPDEALAALDVVVIAVHSHFDLPRARQTRRILRAIDHPHVTLLAHPSGRLIDERPDMDLDLPAVIAAVRERGCYLELNAQPRRMDLWDVLCRDAKEQGVLISIDSDARGTGDFAHLRFGVGQARRGWLEAADVLNTRPLSKLRPLLRSCRRG